MKTVFLIDDDSDDREIFREALDSLDNGYTFAEAVDGEDALNKLQEDGFVKPYIIFLDLNMPRVDGWQFLASVKKMEAYRNIPIIIYSTSSSERDKKNAAENGATGFITKHFSIGELTAELKALLES